MNISPLKAIRLFCIDCVGSSHRVDDCGGEKTLVSSKKGYRVCFFFPFRKGIGRPTLKIIRQSCLLCIGGKPSLIRQCPSTNCAVWPYRMGKNPKRAGQGDATHFKASEMAL
jgi:hypothetical protein